jgi:hypothetical protein
MDEDRSNLTKPSNFLRLQQLRMQIGMCERWGATDGFYTLPFLPSALLDCLDSIEPEHLGPIAVECGEMTRNDDESLAHYDSASHRQYVEVKQHKFMLVGEFRGGAGYMNLYASKTKPNVMYLLESDGESGAWVGTRFGHHDSD